MVIIILNFYLSYLTTLDWCSAKAQLTLDPYCIIINLSNQETNKLYIYIYIIKGGACTCV